VSIDSTIITVLFILLIIYYMNICILSVMVKNPKPPEGLEGEHRFIFMVPCRNEEKVEYWT